MRPPDTAKPADVGLMPMKAIVFFVLLDRLKATGLLDSDDEDRWRDSWPDRHYPKR